MSKEALSRLLKYGITSLVAVGISLGYMFGEGITSAALVDVYRILSDAFTLPALLCLFSGLMVWLSNEGALDAIGYIVSSVVRFLIPFGGLKHEKYSDYVERQKEKRLSGYGFLFVIGLILLAASLVFMGLYLDVHGPI